MVPEINRVSSNAIRVFICSLLGVEAPQLKQFLQVKTTFTSFAAFDRLRPMLKKKLLPLLFAPLLLAGCTATFTNLTPSSQTRNKDNLYPVEVAFNTRQQSMRWDSIRPRIQVGEKYYDMRPTLLMTNRFEGAIPVATGTDIVRYRYKFDFKYNDFGAPMADSSLSPEYTLRIVEGK